MDFVSPIANLSVQMLVVENFEMSKSLDLVIVIAQLADVLHGSSARLLIDLLLREMQASSVWSVIIICYLAI